MIKATRLFTGPDGESHFEDIVIPYEEEMGTSRATGPVKAKDMFFMETDTVHNNTWHTAPCRQMLCFTRGELEIEIGDGTIRRFGVGDVLIAEDTTGHGHLSQAKNRRAVIIRLE